jgi:hypothetical protein
MKRRIMLIALMLVVAVPVLVGYLRVDRGPHAGELPPIAHEYHVCDKCGSLDGGIYGKGPHKRMRSESGNWCVHRWRSISRAEFKVRASEQFGVDWS